MIIVVVVLLVVVVVGVVVVVAPLTIDQQMFLPSIAFDGVIGCMSPGAQGLSSTGGP